MIPNEVCEFCDCCCCCCCLFCTTICAHDRDDDKEMEANTSIRDMCAHSAAECRLLSLFLVRVLGAHFTSWGQTNCVIAIRTFLQLSHKPFIRVKLGGNFHFQFDVFAENRCTKEVLCTTRCCDKILLIFNLFSL